MDCENYQGIISAHVDDALSPKERWAVQTHVNHCPKCRQLYIWETQVARDF
jgi:predicted anti-sigma-YlaC factor YlaD